MNYYLSPNGADTDAGTSQNHAWRTLARANLQQLKPGDALLLQGGATFPGTLRLSADDAGTEAKPVTIASFGNGRALIDAGTETGVDAYNVGGVTIRDLQVRGSGAKTNTGDGVRFFNDLPNGVKLRGIVIENVESHGFGGKRGTHSGGNGIGLTAWPDDQSASGYINVRIFNCETHGNRMNGITVVGVDEPKSATPGFAYSHENVVVENCRAWENAGDATYKENWSGNGIFIADVNGAMINKCEAWRNGYECGATTGGPVGIWTAAANAVTIQNCHSHHNGTGCPFDGGGFDFDGGVTNSVMQFNLSNDNDGAGYLIYEWGGSLYKFDGNIVRHNVSINDGRKNGYAGIYVASDDAKGVRRCAIIHNTVIMNPASTGVPCAIFVRSNVKDVLIANNLFVTSGNVPLFRGEAQTDKTRFLGNAYWSKTPVFEANGKTLTSLAAWREASGQEREGATETGIFADPQFAARDSSAREAARLAPASPLRGRGANLKPELLRLKLESAQPTRDFYGDVAARAATPGAAQ